MSTETISKINQEIADKLEAAKRIAKEITQLKAQRVKIIENNFPPESLIGREYLFYKSKWCNSEQTMHVMGHKNFRGGDEFYMEYQDVVSGAKVKKYMAENKISLESGSIKDDETFIMLTLPEYDELFNKIEEDENQIDRQEFFSEFLFVRIEG